MLENEEYQRRLHSKITRELGREVMTALQDDTVIEVMLNTDGRLWCDRLGEGMSCIGEMSMPNALALLGTIADGLGTVITKQSPIIEGELPLDGSRFEGLIPPVVARPTFTIRKKALLIYTLDDYVQQGIMNAKQKAQIQEAITARRNILVVGGTGSGWRQ